MIVSSGSLLKSVSMLASAAMAFTMAVSVANVAPAVAQSYDDGSYSSDSRGYGDEDDEDGYEDGQDAPDVAYFYDELEDEGTWISSSEYGQVWRPRNIDRDWRPYTRGTWANTEEHGWYWVSDEPFGWATYHYGRWHMDDRYGWVWVPGTRWGPAWVAWRSNDEHIGWAPLPPDAYWDHGHGLRVSASIYEGPRFSAYWSFVEPRYITAPRLYTYCAPPARVVTIINITRPQTNYVFVNRRIVNRGVSVTSIERVTRTRITTVRVNATDNRTYRNVQRNTNTINVYRPKLTRAVVAPRRAGRPAVDRAQFRDVDRRPARKDKPVRQIQKDNAPVTGGNAPYTGPVGLPRGEATGPDRTLRNTRPTPNKGPQGQFRPDGGHNDAAAINRAQKREADRNRNRQKQPNRAAGPGNGPQGGNQQGFNPQAQGDPKAAARKRQQQKRKKNQNED